MTAWRRALFSFLFFFFFSSEQLGANRAGASLRVPTFCSFKENSNKEFEGLLILVIINFVNISKRWCNHFLQKLAGPIKKEKKRISAWKATSTKPFSSHELPRILIWSWKDLNMMWTNKIMLLFLTIFKSYILSASDNPLWGGTLKYSMSFSSSTSISS